MQTQFMSVKELASYLSVSPKTVYSWIYRGFVKPHRFGRIIRFKRSEVEVWLSTFTVGRAED